MSNDNNGELIATLAVAQAQPIEADGTTYLMVPPNYQLTDITQQIQATKPGPLRKNGTVVAQSLDSFLALVIAKAGQGTPIYVDTDDFKMVAVLNDNTADSDPQWRDYRVSYEAEFSDEYRTWNGKDGYKFSQDEFAEFIEANAIDILDPAAAVMLRVSSTLQATSTVQFASAKRLTDGQTQLVYKEDIQASIPGGDLTIPSSFVLGMRLFKNGEGFKIAARLKYRLSGGRLTYFYELDRPRRQLEIAFDSYVAKVREAGFPVYLAKP